MRQICHCLPFSVHSVETVSRFASMSSPPVIRSSSSRSVGLSLLLLGPYVGIRIRATSAAEERSSTMRRVARRIPVLFVIPLLI